MARQIEALIVDDSLTTRKLIMAALKQTGLADFVFTEAVDGVDALDKYRPGETQIIFVDMNMPRMDGLEFVRTLHAGHKSCPPVVMITGEISKERLTEALTESGVDALLLKPVDRDRLRTGLKTIVESIPEPSGPSRVPHGECVPEALQDVLAKACSLDLVSEPEAESVRRGEIVLGMIYVLGDVQWSVVLGFSRTTAEVVASTFAGYDVSADELDLGDAVGEIANMVGGRLKGLLSAHGLSVAVSLPTVISAVEFHMLLQRRRKSAAEYVHFDSTAGKLWTVVTVGIHAGMVL